MKLEFVAFDVETTGLIPQKGDRIIEVGAVSVKDGLIIDEFQSLANPGRPISKKAQSIHGINTEMLSRAPSIGEVMRKFSVFIGESTLIAHNAEFDMRFLRHEMSRCGLSVMNRCLCTLRMGRRLFAGLPDYRLETVYRYATGSPFEKIKVHRALDDAKLVAKIWMKLMRE